MVLYIMQLLAADTDEGGCYVDHVWPRTAKRSTTIGRTSRSVSEATPRGSETEVVVLLFSIVVDNQSVLNRFRRFRELPQW
jgi:hypothetical protein